MVCSELVERLEGGRDRESAVGPAQVGGGIQQCQGLFVPLFQLSRRAAAGLLNADTKFGRIGFQKTSFSAN